MGRYFWILMGLIGFILIILIATGDTGSTLGFETNTLAHVAVAGLWAVLIGGSVFGNGEGIGKTLQQLCIWVLIFLVLMAAYVLRFDIQDLGSRITGGLIPGSPISTTNDEGKTTVTLIRSENGHFEAAAGVNGKSVRFLIDTGASAIVLSAQDAQIAGIDVNSLAYNIRTQTANGTGRSAQAKIESIDVGGIERRNLTVMVAQPGKLNKSLLGQQFLESLSSYEKRGDRLTLRD